jgi:hypothetical protein
VPRVLVAVDGRVGRLVDLHEPGVFGITADDRVILELAEAAREGHVVGAADVLVAEEQHAVLEQQAADLGEQIIVDRRRRQAHVAEFGADVASQLLDGDRIAQGRGADDGRGGLMGLCHGACLLESNRLFGECSMGRPWSSRLTARTLDLPFHATLGHHTPMSCLVRAASLTNYEEVARAAGLDPLRMLADVGLGANVLREATAEFSSS